MSASAPTAAARASAPESSAASLAASLEPPLAPRAQRAAPPPRELTALFCCVNALIERDARVLAAKVLEPRARDAARHEVDLGVEHSVSSISS